jgi:ssDNA-binding Zn-finger/Zn-ribbon topoisomerase 1
MVRRSTELMPHDEIVERPRFSGREVISIRQTLDELGSARCPLCRALLVARQGRKGPVFFCCCGMTPKKRAS